MSMLIADFSDSLGIVTHTLQFYGNLWHYHQHEQVYGFGLLANNQVDTRLF